MIHNNDPDRDALTRNVDKLLNLTTELDQLRARNVELEKLAGESDSSLEFCRYWYGVRLERLSQFIREEIPEPQKTRYFSIIANGTADTQEPPTYAQQFNKMQHRVDALTEALRKAGDLLLSVHIVNDETFPNQGVCVVSQDWFEKRRDTLDHIKKVLE